MNNPGSCSLNNENEKSVPFQKNNRKTTLITAAVWGYSRLVGCTSCWDLRNMEPVEEIYRSGGNLIFAFWHNRFVVMPYIYRCLLNRSRITVIVSQSRDGALVAGFLDRYGFKTVRGSSSRGGRRAMLGLVRNIRNGWDAAVTPDGPRGPRYRVQNGIITLAAATGVPIVPVSYASSLRIIFRGSWDHFRLPLPASRIKVVFGTPLEVEEKPPPSRQEELGEILRQRLRAVDRAAEELRNGKNCLLD